MKYLLILLMAASGAMAVQAFEDKTELTIAFSGISKKVKGDGYLSIYNVKATWLKQDKAFKSIQIPHASIKDGAVTVTVKLPAGDYAFSAWFDKNANGKMNKNFIGIPKEPSGLSNNQRPSFGPPKFKKSLFTVGAEPVTQTIKVK